MNPGLPRPVRLTSLHPKSENPDLDPTDEDLSAGTPIWGTQFLLAADRDLFSPPIQFERNV
jgi:hypothetical protein